jgi:hypothetical protein
MNDVPYWFILLCVTAQGCGPKADEAHKTLDLLTQSRERGDTKTGEAKMTMELNEFHQKDGWMFKRLDDGSVRIRNEALDISHTIPANEWVSVLAFLAPHVGTPESYAAAEAFHSAPRAGATATGGTGGQDQETHE